MSVVDTLSIAKPVPGVIDETFTAAPTKFGVKKTRSFALIEEHNTAARGGVPASVARPKKLPFRPNEVSDWFAELYPMARKRCPASEIHPNLLREGAVEEIFNQ